MFYDMLQHEAIRPRCGHVGCNVTLVANHPIAAIWGAPGNTAADWAFAAAVFLVVLIWWALAVASWYPRRPRGPVWDRRPAPRGREGRA
jgi:hypothetical protein